MPLNTHIINKINKKECGRSKKIQTFSAFFSFCYLIRYVYKWFVELFGDMKTLPPSDEGGGFLQSKKTEGESKKALN